MSSESEGWDISNVSEIERQTSRVGSLTGGILARCQIFGPAFRSAARVSTLWTPVWACAAGDIVFDMCSVTRLLETSGCFFTFSTVNSPVIRLLEADCVSDGGSMIGSGR